MNQRDIKSALQVVNTSGTCFLTILRCYSIRVQRLNMLSNILRNRWFIGSFIFLIVIAALFIVWILHDLASFKKRMAIADYVILQEAMSQKTQNKVQRDVSETKSPDSKENQSESVEDTSVPAEETKKTDTVDKNANIDLAVDASTSPYGFGPYPEVPDRLMVCIPLNQESHTKRAS